MEFRHRKDLTDPEFEGIKLWELIRSGRLIPFAKITFAYVGPPDPISGDIGFIPLLPEHIQERYEHLHSLRAEVCRHEQFQKRNPAEVWEASPEHLRLEIEKIDPATETFAKARNEFDKGYCEQLKLIESKLSRIRPEIVRLEREFADFSGSYSRLDLTSNQCEEFIGQLEDAYFRLDQIESVQREVAAADRPQFSFFLNGTRWNVGPYGREKDFGNLLGYRYIHFLLQYPSVKISCIDVYQQEIGVAAKFMPMRSERGMSEKAVKEIEELIHDFKERHQASEDFEERDKLQEQIERVEKAHREAKRNLLGNQAFQNRRTGVYNRIKKAKDEIEAAFKESAPELVQEMQRVHARSDCWYEGQASWRLKP